MANDAITAVNKCAIGNAGAKRVLSYLADRAQAHGIEEDWTCFPSVQTIADELEVSVKSVERGLAYLVQQNWLRCRRLRYTAGKLKGCYRGYRFRLNRKKLLDGLAARLAQEAALRAAETALEPADWDEDGEDVTFGSGDARGDEPSDRMSDGGPDNLSGTIRQSGAEPSDNLTGQEPKDNPQLEPTAGARAGEPTGRGKAGGKAEDDPFWRLVAAYPASAKATFSEPLARAASKIAIGKIGGHLGEAVERLIEAARRFAADPVLKARDYGARSLHRWLGEETWRVYLPEPGWTERVAVAAEQLSGPTWNGPPWLRAGVIAVSDEGWFNSWIIRSAWDEASRTLTLKTKFAFDTVRREHRVWSALTGEDGLDVTVTWSGAVGSSGNRAA